MNRLLAAVAVASALISGAESDVPAWSKSYEFYLRRLDQYLDTKLYESRFERLRSWNRVFHSLAEYEASVEPNRQRFMKMIGGFDRYARTPLEPRIARTVEMKDYTASWVTLAAMPGLEASGVLLVPRKRESKMPAVIFQHGQGGVPEAIAGLLPPDDEASNDSYRQIGARLAREGFVVWVNRMTQGPSTKSRLDRKAILAGQRLQALEQWMLVRVIDYLQSRPEVRPDRIGIYGKSWGGRTAMYLGAMDKRIAAVVENGHLMPVVEKMVMRSTHYTPYLDTPEDYAFFPNMANEFSDSDIVSLICPRPFFAEHGETDRVAYAPMVQAEVDVAKTYYRKLGIEDRIGMEIFPGDHEIHGVGAVAFLKKWLFR